MIVTFCGHKEIHDKEKVTKWLEEICIKLIKEGANQFYLGGYGNFDRLAHSILLKHKTNQIKIYLIIPYLNSNISSDNYDGTIYPELEKTPFRFAISKRNQWMVESSDCLVAYVVHSYGGANNTLIYAKRKNKNIYSYSD